jgi:hypothetical protein
MRKGEFDLKGKAIDCHKLPAMGDAGKEIFRALKVACNGGEHPKCGQFEGVSDFSNGYLILYTGIKLLTNDSGTDFYKFEIIQPSDVLGQAAIDAAMDGATLVFEGDDVPSSVIQYYDEIEISPQKREGQEAFVVDGDMDIIAYKLLDEKPRLRVPSIESRVLAEKVGFKELRPVRSPDEWKEREREAYDDLRDTHIENVRELMEKDKEIELLKQRIKDMHRALNDIESMADKIKVSTNV